MSLRIGRTAEFAYRPPLRAAAPQPVAADQCIPPGFHRLMEVTITNTYYESQRQSIGQESGSECLEFCIVPTRSTQFLMQRLGLLLRRNSAGFSIGYDTARSQSLIDYLRLQGQLRLEHEEAAKKCENKCKDIVPHNTHTDPYWTRLSFTLALTNPDFISFTRLPPNRNPCGYNLYYTNQRAHTEHEEEGSFRHREQPVAPPPFVDAIWSAFPQHWLPVVASRTEAPVPLSVNEVAVLDIAGTQVMCESRWKPNALGVPKATEMMYLDFSELPEDKYTICWDGGQKEVLYTTAAPTPLAFIDLLFSNPTGVDAAGPEMPSRAMPPLASRTGGVEDSFFGVYPVTNLASEAWEIRPVSYELKFDARKTVWIYYVIQQPPHRYTDLKITPGTVTSTRQEPISFDPLPMPVEVQPGVWADCFVSSMRIPLKYTNQWFQLDATRNSSSAKAKNGPLVKYLPTASTRLSRLLPAVAEQLPQDDRRLKSDFSEMYVYI